MGKEIYRFCFYFVFDGNFPVQAHSGLHLKVIGMLVV